ncbi:hypothetical protein K4749_40345 [Streptomyces sp. TRM72054]|uniref:hypothetical protein n=1 Tax=Streptomyces sp. TRM72054 TaxID=2870562 RepID=UPI001C8C691A|nr:hypothetical protein [Streptomyces sp. TRM72054]MBX9399595.1 hypothetical protein [Streptomyces sp. TRM72054]
MDYQDRGIDLLLSGQSPLGELLAAPSAPLLDGIAVCLVDVADPVRRARLAERAPGRWDPKAIDAYIGWAAWHRKHALDPSHRPDVIIDNSWPEMAWHRWTGWNAGDPRWHTQVLDTTNRPVTESVDQVEQWITEQRDAHQAGQLPLSHGWASWSIRTVRSSDPVPPEAGVPPQPVDEASPTTSLVAQSDGISSTFAPLPPRRSYFA